MSSKVIFGFSQVVRILDVGAHVVDSVYTHPDRMLNWNVFLYVREGHMQVIEEDKEYIVGKGQFLFLKMGLHHWGAPKTTAGTSWYWIHFYDNCSVTSNETVLKRTGNSYGHCIQLPKSGTAYNASLTEKRLEDMVSLFRSNDPLKMITLSMQVTSLFLDIFRKAQNVRSQPKADRTIRRVVEFLNVKERYALNAKEIEQSLNMNYSYLCDVFKQKTGQTISSYNARIFICKAIQLMQSTDDSLTEISDALGFSNPFYFSRVFRNVVGCSPSAYRKNLDLGEFQKVYEEYLNS